MKKNSLAKNTILLSIGTILNKGLVFFMVPLFSSWLSTEDYGTFDLLCTYVTMLIPILSLAIGEGIFRYAIEAKEKEQKQHITNGTIMYIIGMIIAGIAALIMFVFFHINIIIPFYIMLCGEIINKLLQSFLRAIKKLNIYSFFSAISTVFIFISTWILVKVLNLGLYGIIYGYAIGYLIGDIIIAIYSKFPRYITKNWSFKGIKELIVYSLPLIPNSISWWIVNASDRTIINMVLGAASNGIYAIAYKIPNLCTSVFSVFSISWQEAAIDMKNSANRNEYFQNVYTKMILILISLCAGILSLNFILFTYFFDAKYSTAQLYTPILVTSVIFSTIAQFFGGIQISLKQQKSNGVTTITGAIVNILVHLALIKYIGLYASAISTLASTVTIVIARKIILKKDLDIKVERKIYKYLLIYAYIAICAFFCSKLNIIINVINLLITIAVFLIINKEMLKKILKKLKVIK